MALSGRTFGPRMSPAVAVQWEERNNPQYQEEPEQCP